MDEVPIGRDDLELPGKKVEDMEREIRIAKVIGKPIQIILKYQLLVSTSASLIDRTGRLMLRFYRLFEPNCPIYVYLLYLSYFLFISYFGLIGFAQWYSNKLYFKWLGTTNQLIDEANKCRIISNISVNDGSVEVKMHSILGLLNWLGAPFHPRNDLAFMEFYLATCYVFILALTRILYWNCRFSPSPLSFLSDPEKQLYQDQRDKQNIIEKLIEHKHHSTNSPQLYREVPRSKNDTSTWHKNRKCICCSFDRLERTRVLNIITQISIIHKLLPRSHTSGAYKILLIVFTLSMFGNLTTLFFDGLNRNDHYLQLETKIQADLTNEHNQCARLHPNATSIRDPLRHPYFKDLNYKLMTPIELTSFLSLRSNLKQLMSTNKPRSFNVLMLFKILSQYSIALGSKFILLMIGLSLSDRILWTKQIFHQMNDCLESLKSYNSLSPDGDIHCHEQKFKLEQILSMTLINLKLFLLEDQQFRNYMNLSSTWASLYLLLLSPIMSSINDDSNHESALFIRNIYLYTILISNLYLITSRRTLNSYRRLFRLQSIVVGHLAISDLHDSLLCYRWRQMMLDDSRVQEIFASILFGLKLDERQIYSMNSSLIGAFILIVRSHYTPSS